MVRFTDETSIWRVPLSAPAVIRATEWLAIGLGLPSGADLSVVLRDSKEGRSGVLASTDGVKRIVVYVHEDRYHLNIGWFFLALAHELGHLKPTLVPQLHPALAEVGIRVFCDLGQWGKEVNSALFALDSESGELVFDVWQALYEQGLCGMARYPDLEASVRREGRAGRKACASRLLGGMSSEAFPDYFELQVRSDPEALATAHVSIASLLRQAWNPPSTAENCLNGPRAPCRQLGPLDRSNDLAAAYSRLFEFVRSSCSNEGVFSLAPGTQFVTGYSQADQFVERTGLVVEIGGVNDAGESSELRNVLCFDPLNRRLERSTSWSHSLVPVPADPPKARKKQRRLRQGQWVTLDFSAPGNRMTPECSEDRRAFVLRGVVTDEYRDGLVGVLFDCERFPLTVPAVALGTVR